MAAEGYHEPYEQLTAQTRDLHRAFRSLMEELEAVDWYQQRVDTCHDDELRAILAHNRDEEKEHAAMVLEWIRRRDAVFDEQLRRYLFGAGSIVKQEAEAEAQAAGKKDVPSTSANSTIGSLRRMRGSE